MRRVWLAAVAVVAVSAGCGQSPSSSEPAAAVGPVFSGSARQAGQALAKDGDWAGAVVKYREALRSEPDDVLLHFALGSALSHLDRRDEAIEQFRWVVARGAGTLPEVAAAREWLHQAGALDAFAVSASPATATAIDPRSAGTLVGKTSWPGVSKESFNPALQILLVPDEPATKQSKNLAARVHLGESYSISPILEGRYRLMAQVGPVRLWDTRVQVTAGKETVLDLGPETSLVSPDEFPPHRRPKS